MTSRRFEIPTWSGRRWSLLYPRPEDVFFPDIAEQLARLCRSVGAMDPFWSIASHSLLVAEILASYLGRPDLRPYGLLHDGHEAFVGDRIQPLRDLEAFLNPKAASVFLDIVARHDEAIHTAAGLRFPLEPEDRIYLKHADELAWATERRQFIRLRRWEGPGQNVEPLPIKLQPVEIPEAAQALKRAFAAHGFGA